MHGSNAARLLGPGFSEEGAQDIFCDPDAIRTGALNLPRLGKPIEGGFKLAGQTAFCSGVHDAQGVLGLSHVLDGDAPRHGKITGMQNAVAGHALTIEHNCAGPIASAQKRQSTWSKLGANRPLTVHL